MKMVYEVRFVVNGKKFVDKPAVYPVHFDDKDLAERTIGAIISMLKENGNEGAVTYEAREFEVYETKEEIFESFSKVRRSDFPNG